MKLNALAVSLVACSGLFGQDEGVQRKFFADVQQALDNSLPADTTNIEVQLGKTNDPLLPAASFDAVLISNAYHEMRASEFDIVRRQEPLLLDGSTIKYSIAAQLAKPAQSSAQTDSVSALASAKESDALREPAQRASVILRAMDLKSGDSAADVGAGGGYYTARLSSMVSPNGRVFAVEVRESSLALLKQRAAADHLENVVVVRGEANNPHLEAGSLDAVLIVDAYHEMKEYEGMLEHIHRALKPGGRLVIADYSDRPGRNQPREDQTKKHFLPPELVREELKKAGFEIIKLDDPLLERKREVQNARIGTADLWLLTARRPL